MKYLIALLIVTVVVTVRPAIDRSEEAAIWVGEDGIPNLDRAIDIAARQAMPRVVRVPCGVYFADLSERFWAKGVMVQGSGIGCTHVEHRTYGIEI